MLTILLALQLVGSYLVFPVHSTSLSLPLTLSGQSSSGALSESSILDVVKKQAVLLQNFRGSPYSHVPSVSIPAKNLTSSIQPSLVDINFRHLEDGLTKARSIYSRAEYVQLSGRNVQFFFLGTAHLYDYRFPDTLIMMTSNGGVWNTPTIVASNSSISEKYRLMDHILFYNSPVLNVHTLQEAKTLAQKFAQDQSIQVDTDIWDVYVPPRSEDERLHYGPWNLPEFPVVAFPATGVAISPANPKLYVRLVDPYGDRDSQVFAAPKPVAVQDQHEQNLFDMFNPGVLSILNNGTNFHMIANQYYQPDVSAQMPDGWLFPIFFNGTCANNGFDTQSADPITCDVHIDQDSLATFNWTDISPSAMRNISSTVKSLNAWKSTQSSNLTVDTGYYSIFRPSESARRQLAHNASDSLYYQFSANTSDTADGFVLVDAHSGSVYRSPSTALPDPVISLKM